MPTLDEIAKPHIYAVGAGYLASTLTYALALFGIPWSLETFFLLLLSWAGIAFFGGALLLALLAVLIPITVAGWGVVRRIDNPALWSSSVGAALVFAGVAVGLHILHLYDPVGSRLDGQSGRSVGWLALLFSPSGAVAGWVFERVSRASRECICRRRDVE